MERTSSAKLDEMLSIQKSASNRTGLGFGLSSSNIASSRTTVFVFPANNVKIENNEIKTELASENIDKGKSILGASLKLEKKDVKNLRAKKADSQKPKQKWSCRSYSIIIVELSVILDQIATSGLPFNRVTA